PVAPRPCRVVILTEDQSKAAPSASAASRLHGNDMVRNSHQRSDKCPSRGDEPATCRSAAPRRGCAHDGRQNRQGLRARYCPKVQERSGIESDFSEIALDISVKQNYT